MPKLNKSNLKAALAIIILLAIAAFAFDFPWYFNQGIDWINNKLPLLKIDVLFNYIGFSNFRFPKFPSVDFHLGLDLKGGTHLVYQADLSQIEKSKYGEAMEGIRDVIERRINIYGVTEPLVQIAKSGDSWRLIVDLAGVKDINEAIKMIGETPFLDFREEKAAEETEKILKEIEAKNPKYLNIDPYFNPTELNGKYLKSAQLIFDQTTYQPQIELQFNEEGAKLFEQLTEKNVGKKLAIYLDGQPISIPVVKEKISGGKAVISGNFSINEAKILVQKLNSGALPVPIKLISQETVGATLGKIDLEKSIRAGIIGFILVIVFMIFYYRFAGFLAAITLIFYLLFNLAIFKLIPVTLTLSGIAGFILSLGMAVDANVLIFERMKEELKKGMSLSVAVSEGFKRAWPSIRDGNATTILTALILFWFTSSMIKGFALTLLFGVILSMFSAIIITRVLLKLLIGTRFEEYLNIVV